MNSPLSSPRISLKPTEDKNYKDSSLKRNEAMEKYYFDNLFIDHISHLFYRKGSVCFINDKPNQEEEEQ